MSEDDTDWDAVFAELKDSEPAPDVTLPDPPESGDQGDDDDSGPRCEECQTVIPWSGRGRRPKRCIDHKTRTAGKSTRSRGGKAPVRVAQFEADIRDGLAELGGSLSAVLPVTGVFTCQRAPGVASALARIAQEHPKMLAAMSAGVRGVSYVRIGEFIVGLALALSIDIGRIPPDTIAARTIGLTAIAEEIGLVEKAEPAPEEPVNAFAVATPPRFQTIR